MRTVSVTRNKAWYGRLRTAIVLADDVEVGRVKVGATANIHIPDQASNLYVKMDWGRSTPYPVNHIKDGQTLYVNGWFTLNPLRNMGILSIPIAIEDEPR